MGAVIRIGLFLVVVCLLSGTPLADDERIPLRPQPVEVAPTTYDLSEFKIVMQTRRAWSAVDDTVSISGDGTAEYRGRGGRREFRVSSDQVEEIFHYLYGARFFDLDDKYGSDLSPTIEDDTVRVYHGHVSDQTMVKTTVYIGEFAKSVFDEWGAPWGLRVLQDVVFEIAGMQSLDRTYGNRYRKPRQGGRVTIQGRLEKIEDNTTDGGGVRLHLRQASGDVAVVTIPPFHTAPTPPAWQVELYMRVQTLELNKGVIATGVGTRDEFELRGVITDKWRGMPAN